MSLEHELAELSTVYHGQRERMEALEQLVKDLLDCLEDEQQTLADYRRNRAEFQQRARELLGDKP